MPNVAKPSRGVSGKPTAFSDLRDREAAERNRSLGRQIQLRSLKRSRTTAEEAELEEINTKLDSDAVVDPLFKAVQKNLTPDVSDHHDGLLPSQVAAAKKTDLKDSEKMLAAVFGLLEADQIQPPVYHLEDPPPYPDDPSVAQGFGKALYGEQGEYVTNKPLFWAVLPILEAIGDQGLVNTVSAQEWAQVVRILVSKGVTEQEPQLARKVQEALDTIQNVGGDLPPSDIGIDLPDLDQTTSNSEIVGDNVRALQPTYFSAMFEELRVFQVVDKLVELFQNGVLPIGRGEAGNRLFKYWKEAALRVSEAERRAFYARTLGVTSADVDMPNREFNDLWMRFISAVNSFMRQNTVDDLLHARYPGSISQQQIRKSGRDLATNLSLHGYGMAYSMATELQKQIREVIDILSQPEIKNAYGARDMWQVIDQVATLELGGAKNSVRYRTVAASGAIVIAWLAKRSNDLSNSTYQAILDIDEIRRPLPRPSGSKPTVDPYDSDLVNACAQWLAVTGTQDDTVDSFAQPKEAPAMTSKPIQIPAIARDMLDSVGVPAMASAASAGNGNRNWRY